MMGCSVFVRLLSSVFFVVIMFIKDSSCVFGSFSIFQSISASILILPVFVLQYAVGKWFCFVSYVNIKNSLCRGAIFLYELAIPVVSMASFSLAISNSNNEKMFACYTDYSWVFLIIITAILFDFDGGIRRWIWDCRHKAFREIPDNGVVSSSYYWNMVFGIVSLNCLPFVIGIIYGFV